MVNTADVQTGPTEPSFDPELLVRKDGADLWSPEYLTDEFGRAAIKSLMQEHGNPEQPFGVYFIDGQDPRSSLGRMVELARFASEFSNDADYLRRLYQEFEEAGTTEIIAVVDHVNLKPAGVIRLVGNTAEHGCRILNDLKKDGENGWGLGTDEEIRSRAHFVAQTPEEILDIPTIAVSKGYGRNVFGVVHALEAGVFQRSLYDTQAKTWVCSLARVPYNLIQADTQNAFHEFEGVSPQPYYGDDDTTPLWCNIRELADNLRDNYPETYAKYHDSAGLDDYFFAR